MKVYVNKIVYTNNELFVKFYKHSQVTDVLKKMINYLYFI